MVDDSDPPKFSKQRIRKARKEHFCDECTRMIRPSEPYQYATSLSVDSKIYTYKTCQHCLVAQNWLEQECDGWIYGMVCQDIEEHANKYSQYAKMQWDLYRIAVGMQREWKSFKDETALLPVPKMPKSITEYARLGDEQ